MEAIKLKGRIGTDAALEWIEPLPDLPPGEVEIIVLYERRQVVPVTDVPADAMDDTRDDPHGASPDEIAARLQWIDEHAGSITLPAAQSLELAMDDGIGEENLPL